MVLEMDRTHYTMGTKELPHEKKNLYNQPKPYFFKKIL
jgi:hypothetical protein